MKHPIFSSCCLALGLLISACDSGHISNSTQTSAAAKATARYALQEAGIKNWKSPAKDIMDTYYLAYYQEEEQGYLVWEDKFNKALEFYGWEDDSLTSIIKLDEQLIRKRCDMRGAYIASLDSVYLLNPMDPRQYKLHLYNKNSIMRHTLMSNDSSLEGIEKAMPQIDANSPAIRRGDWIHLLGLPENDLGQAITYSKGRIDVAINLKTGEYRYGYRYPAAYEEYGSKGNCLNVSRCLTADGKFLYSFGIEDSVVLTDHQQQEQRFYAGSNYISSSSIKAKAAISDRSSFPDSPTATYGGILHDPVHNVYYRMALHDITDSTVSRPWDNQPVSIIILNKRLEKVGETLLPAGKHLSYQWFVGPDGLYIANHYNHRHQANIGELSFTHYKVVAEGNN